MTKYKIHYADKSYYEALYQTIAKAQKRLLLETMVIDLDGKMRTVIDGALGAASRGVDVVLIYDKYVFFNAFLKGGPKAVRKLGFDLKKLESSGIKLIKVGKVRLNPFSGRNHVKAVISDDIVLTGGGINLTNSSLKSKDFMIEFESKALADKLFHILPDFAVSRQSDEVVYQTNDYRILIDGGQYNKSLIYETACELASRADEVWYVSKLTPDNRLLSILKGKNTHYWYNTPRTVDFFDGLAISIDSLKHSVPNRYNSKKLLHAKMLVFKMPEGHYESLSGSHNLNYRGVRFGTQELVLHSTSQHLSMELIKFAYSLSR